MKGQIVDEATEEITPMNGEVAATTTTEAARNRKELAAKAYCLCSFFVLPKPFQLGQSCEMIR